MYMLTQKATQPYYCVNSIASTLELKLTCEYKIVLTYFLKKGKYIISRLFALIKKMNNTKRCKVLLKTLDRVYEEYPNTNDFINKSSEEIGRNENLPSHQVSPVCFGFLCCCLYRNLWLAMFYYHKQKIKNDAFDCRTKHSQKQ